MAGTTQREIDYKETARLIKLADMVAFRHFADHYGDDYPYVDRAGRPVPVVDTEKYTSARYRVYGKNGKVGRPTAEKVREVYAKPIELMLDVFASFGENLALAMVDAALGAKVLRTDDYGNEIEVYVRPPDAKAVDMILNRLMGKPTEDRTVRAEVETKEQVIVYVPDNHRGPVQLSGSQADLLNAPDDVIEVGLKDVVRAEVFDEL